MALNQFKKLAGIVLFHRKRAGLSRRQLSDLAGVGKTAIFDMEHGKETVKLSTVIKILNTLNIRLSFNGPFTKEYEESLNEKS